jgi:uncharacterized protein YebE (UPF0316 family)
MVELLASPWGPLLIFLLRIVDVSMATVRVTSIVRGPRWLAPVIGFFEILIWVVAVGAAIQNLGSWLHVVGYAGGYATGTAVGMWVESRLALGWGVVRTISRGPAGRLAAALRDAGFGVTEQAGHGKSGPVDVLYAVVRRRQIPKVLDIIDEVEPESFVTVQADATVRRGLYAAGKRA